MKIELKEITVAKLVDGYKDNAHEGVIGYGGRLDIRPKYQREFVYGDEQRSAVIDTLRKDFPLNVMYWAVRDDGDYEVIDGQQRTISICQYVKGVFSYNELYFENLPDDQQKQVMDYKLTVYLCSGEDSEKLEWFKIVNIAGVKLSDQELRNAVYSGSWVTDAKRYFSKSGCVAYSVGNQYLTGSAIRQEYFETAIKWIAGGKNNIENYMGKHQHNAKAEPLWDYFRAVIEWVEKVFPKYRKEMKGLDWGNFYNKYKNEKYDAGKLEMKIGSLMEDEEVTKKGGIYEYVLTGNETCLNIRAFTEKQKREAYERQKKKCAICKKEFQLNEMDADHKKPWAKGGKTIPENCQMLCRECNQRKSAG